jgi:predicted PurR-regulated permease PerM
LLAALTQPLYHRLVRKLRGRSGLAAGIVVLAVMAAVTVPTVFLSVSLAEQAASAYATVRSPAFSEQAAGALFGDHWLAARVRDIAEVSGIEYTPEGVKNALRDAAGSAIRPLSEKLNTLVSNVFDALYHFLILLVIVYYGLVDGPHLKQRVFALSPLPDDEEQMFVERFADVGRAIVFGNGIGSLLQGSLSGLAMWAAGLSSPLFWGAVMTLFAFLGLIGISVVVIPATCYLLLRGDVGTATGFFAFCIVQTLFVENVVKTKLIGGHVQMHSLLIFLSLLGGITAFGLWGIVYGPLVVALFLTAIDLYEHAYRDRLLSR